MRVLQSLSDASDDTTADATDMTVQQSDDWPRCSFDWDSAQVSNVLYEAPGPNRSLKPLCVRHLHSVVPSATT
jgi:hypothetical protein